MEWAGEGTYFCTEQQLKARKRLERLLGGGSLLE
jgi:hypothetical protein